MNWRAAAIAVSTAAVAFLVAAQAVPTTADGASAQPSGEITAGRGDTVLLHYTAQTTDGEVFEKTEGEAPRGIRLGEGLVIPALEQGLLGIAPGDKRRIEIASADAFGPYRDEPGMKTRIPRATLAHSLDPQVGMRLNAAVFADEDATEARHVPVTIVEVTDEYLLVDANHPLAGKDLVFEVEAVDVIPAGHLPIGHP